jgi:hypothetical protein
MIAFWGAASIGVRSSTEIKIQNPFKSIWYALGIIRRSSRVVNPLFCGSWAFISPKYRHTVRILEHPLNNENCFYMRILWDLKITKLHAEN